MLGVDAGVVDALWYPVSAARLPQSFRHPPGKFPVGGDGRLFSAAAVAAAAALALTFSLLSEPWGLPNLGSRHTGGGSTPVCLALSLSARARGPPTLAGAAASAAAGSFLSKPLRTLPHDRASFAPIGLEFLGGGRGPLIPPPIPPPMAAELAAAMAAACSVWELGRLWRGLWEEAEWLDPRREMLSSTVTSESGMALIKSETRQVTTLEEEEDGGGVR